MKNLNLFECQGVVVKDVTFKDVVIIGNGPSGISLSYFLAGNWPYWNPEAIKNHPDELLKNRLKFLDSNRSLIEHDLYSLTQGLEGRTTNPVSLLFDSLHHPGADAGLKLSSMLEYKYHKDKEIDHVVLGKGNPGGAWHSMDRNLRTLSLAEWMSLPNMNFNEWEQNFTARCSNVDTADDHIEPADQNKGNFKRRISEEVKTRALVASVADYYASYVKLMNLEKFFRSETVVMKIREVKKNDTIFNNSKFENARWIVQGFDRKTKKPFIIGCKKIVLANGTSDLANRLGVRGEQKTMSWLKYELPSLEHAIKSMKVDEKLNSKPVLIVGAGLSAADAVIACRNSGINVIHVFRSLTSGFMNLPQAYFPEYNMVYEMMRNSQTQEYELYKALPECALKEIKSSSGKHLVTIQNLRNEDCQTYEVSHCAILIGSRPDLSLLNDLSANSKIPIIIATSVNENSTENFILRTLKRLKVFCEKCRHLNLCFGFLQKHPALISSLIEESNVNGGADEKKENCDDTGLGYGESPERPIDVKNNPIAVNKFSNELLQTPGIYALGPLVGDNFVRFIAGGALSITSSFHNETK